MPIAFHFQCPIETLLKKRAHFGVTNHASIYLHLLNLNDMYHYQLLTQFVSVTSRRSSLNIWLKNYLIGQKSYEFLLDLGIST